jgi:hypothetical protein
MLMLTVSIRTLLEAKPFVPFTIVMMGGNELRIPNPEAIKVSHDGVVAHVTRSDGAPGILNLRLAAELWIDDDPPSPMVVNAGPELSD